jgi:Ni,Fe-hydrogenase III large subunit
VSYKIPIGPFHPALEEPFKLELTCEGETVRDAALFIKFNFRGVEWLAERRNYVRAVALVERVCGICSHIHALTFSRCVEQLAGIEVPERAQYIRVIVSELERIASHTLFMGVAAEVAGFQAVFMTCFALREKVMDILETLSGNRVHHGMCCIGGVNRDISDPEAILPVVRAIREEMQKKVIPIFTSDRTIRSRCKGIGILSESQARSWGTVGPTARGSGVREDIRKTSPYAAYDRLDFNVPVETAGDILARVKVRLLETVESCRIIEQGLRQLPRGPLRGPDFVEVPPGEAIARSEAPRGECFYYVASNGTDTPLRVKIRTPSYVNMPIVRLMVLQADLADVPLINASIDPCYSCTSR